MFSGKQQAQCPTDQQDQVFPVTIVLTDANKVQLTKTYDVKVSKTIPTPPLSIATSSLSDAVAGSAYSGVVFATDLERAKNVASRIRTGTFGINGGLWYGADAPFGGYKQSGIGRQCGIEGLEIFTETKTVGWPAS